jgi:NADH-quinone oxidoreductase subunit C
VANEPLLTKEAVFEALAGNHAIQALRSADEALITGARYDRNELSLDIRKDSIRRACEIVKAAGYNFFEDCTCVDWFPAEPRFQVTYHILSHGLKERVRLRAFVDSADPSVESITGVWPSANFYEREVWDLFGVRFHGHPDLRRIMMPEEWEGHPLQKTYPVEGYR